MLQLLVAHRVRLLAGAFVGACGGWFLALLLNWRSPLSLAPVVVVVLAAVQPGAWGRLRATLPCNGPALALLTWYALVVISGAWSEDQPEWRHLLFRYLPFVAVALIFSLARPLTSTARYGLGLLLVGATTLVALATAARFLADYAAQNELINLSQTMPAATGMFHIHFGLLLTLAACLAPTLARAARARDHHAVAWALYGAMAVLIGTMHGLAYRSALLTFYAVVTVVALRALWQPGRRWLGAALFATMLLAPVVAYQTLAPIRLRVGNTLYDLDRFRNGKDINDYSLSQRLAAWSNAGVLLRHHGWGGVAPADVPLELARQYEWRSFGLRPANRVQLHNQYLFAWLGLGVPGLLCLVAIVGGPLVFNPTTRRDACAVVVLVTLATVMLVDTPFALKGGLNVFLLFYGLLVVEPRQRALLASQLPLPPAGRRGAPAVFPHP